MKCSGIQSKAMNSFNAGVGGVRMSGLNAMRLRRL